MSVRRIKLSKRLLCAAELTGCAEVIADVGTDHAYLPIYMLAEGKAERAVATDINMGPLERAKANARLYNVVDRLTLLRTDGLRGVERYSPDVVVIAGMGGELSASIIEKADFLRKYHQRIVCQPMTHSELLRAALCRLGFVIYDERTVYDGKLYQLFAAEYTGENENYSNGELLVGRISDKDDPLTAEDILSVIRRLKKEYNGILSSDSEFKNKDNSDLQKLYNTIEELCSMAKRE